MSVRTKTKTTWTCLECGGTESARRWSPSLGAEMQAAGACFDCHHWISLLDPRYDGVRVVVGGVHYTIGDTEAQALDRTRSREPWEGFGGFPFLIRFKNGRERLTRDLWCQGTIPERFRDRLPDNADFAPQSEAWARLNRR